ncbi:Interleukin-9 receptor, partial [Galemys pyrenaicus]
LCRGGKAPLPQVPNLPLVQPTGQETEGSESQCPAQPQVCASFPGPGGWWAEGAGPRDALQPTAEGQRGGTCSMLPTNPNPSLQGPAEGRPAACAPGCSPASAAGRDAEQAATGASPGPDASTPVCVTNFILRIDCRWAGAGLGPGQEPWLLLTNNQMPGSQHRCVFQAGACSVQLPAAEVLLPSDSFNITLHRRVSGREQVSLVDPQFLPRRYVRLDPPSDVQTNVSAGRCFLTWGVHPVLQSLGSLLSYELAFKRREEAWEARHKGHILGVNWLILEAAELEPGATYEARLRVQMAPLELGLDEQEHFRGQWSAWSQPARFPAPRRPGRPPVGQPDRTLVVTVSTLLLLTSLAYLLFKLSPRWVHAAVGSKVKRTLCQNVPSPAAFFQPLYSRHGGDFQTWAGGAHLRPQQSSGDGARPTVLEAVAPLTVHPAHPWRPAGLPEGAPAPEEAGPPPAYLPQEDWALLASEGSSGDYCASSLCGAEHPQPPQDAWEALGPPPQQPPTFPAPVGPAGRPLLGWAAALSTQQS